MAGIIPVPLNVLIVINFFNPHNNPINSDNNPVKYSPEKIRKFSHKTKKYINWISSKLKTFVSKAAIKRVKR